MESKAHLRSAEYYVGESLHPKQTLMLTVILKRLSSTFTLTFFAPHNQIPAQWPALRYTRLIYALLIPCWTASPSVTWKPVENVVRKGI